MLKNEISNPTILPLSEIGQLPCYISVMNGINTSTKASAGAGKTFTVGAITFNYDGTVHHVPFGRALSDSQKEKFSHLANVIVSNFHVRALQMNGGGIDVDTDKLRGIAMKVNPSNANRLAELVKMFKTEAYGLDTCRMTEEEIAVKYGFPYELIEDAIKVLALSDEMRKSVDFEDMMRFAVLDKRVSTDPDALYVLDEVQDYTPLSWAFLKNCLTTKDSKVYMVGDPDRQTLMAFAGASADLFDEMSEYFGCTEITMPVNRRCAKAIVEAAPFKGDMVALDDAPEGEVTTEPCEDIVNAIADGLYENDAVLSETNAPLVLMGINLLVKNVPVRMRTAKLDKMIMRYAYPYLDTRKFKVGTIADQLDKDIAQRESDGGDVGEARDVSKCIRALEEYCISKDMLKPKFLRRGKRFIPQNPIQTALEILTSGDKGITLMTGHTAKGLEWDTVFHLPASGKEPDQEWQVQQNNCLAHVIATRAIRKHVTLIMG